MITEVVVDPKILGSTLPANRDPTNTQIVPMSQKVIVLGSAMLLSFFLRYLNLMVKEFLNRFKIKLFFAED